MTARTATRTASTAASVISWERRSFMCSCLGYRGLRGFDSLQLGRGPDCDRGFGHSDTSVGCDLEHHVLVSDLANGPVDAARGDHLVALFEVAEQGRLLLAPPALRHDDQHPEEEEHQDEEDERVQTASLFSRSRVSALKDASLPSSIAARAPAVSCR